MPEAFSKLSFSGKSEASTQNDHTFMEDITTKYFLACNEGLELGELVRADDFSLQDSIAALEIMDPKMDNGVIDPEEESSTLYDCSSLLLPDELISIIDQLLASEMSWHGGSSLSQTLYTCVYVQRLLGKSLQNDGFSKSTSGTAAERALLDQVLFPYVVATIKCVDICRDEFLAGYLYEEEDISSADFGLELLPFTQAETAIALLEEGLRWLETMRQEKESTISTSQYTQLYKRLKVRALLLKMLHNMKSLESFANLVPVLLLELNGYTVSERPLGDFPHIFNTAIQRSLISTSPPRPIVSMPATFALSELRRLCEDMVRLLPITSAARKSPSCMLAFFEMIRKNNPPTLPLVRSRLQSIFLEDKMAQHVVEKQDFIIIAIEEICGQRLDLFDRGHSKVETPNDRRFKINQIVSEILNRIDPQFLDYYKVLCHNPGRQRRNLCKILVDFDVLQAEAEVIDQDLAALVAEEPKRLANGNTSLSFPISSWIFNTKLDICLLILFMGFETDLYKPFEWSVIYWHLENFYFLQSEHLYSIVIDRLPNYSPVRAHLAHRLLYNEAQGLLCKAYCKLTTSLEMLSIIKMPNLKFSSEELLYNHRMIPFSRLISPPSVSFEMYKAEKETRKASAVEMLKDASDHFNAARLKLATLSKRGPSQRFIAIPALVDDFKAEIRGLVGCCIANNLMVSKLLKEDAAWFKSGDRKLVYQESQFSRRFPSISIM